MKPHLHPAYRDSRAFMNSRGLRQLRRMLRYADRQILRRLDAAGTTKTDKERAEIAHRYLRDEAGLRSQIFMKAIHVEFSKDGTSVLVTK